MYYITATGKGEVCLYVNNEIVANPYVIERGYEDQIVKVTATTQEEGKLKSAAFMEIVIPARQPDIEGEEFFVNGVTFKMITVDGGTFTMGDNSIYGSSPAHQVTLSDYKIGQTEVTQALWQAVMGNNPSCFTGNLQRPVEQVSWDDCQEFVLKLNQLTGKCFRLPTEAEWEFAARGGNFSQGYRFAGSNDIDNVGWCYENSDFVTHEVMTKAPNELGIYDMSGNVWECCQDYYGDYNDTAQTNPTGPVLGYSRICRGGHYEWDESEARTKRRYHYSPMESHAGTGFRLALDEDDSPKFRLSETVMTVEVGESKTVDILNGNGSYTVAGSTTNFTRSIVSGKLKVTGIAVGTNTVTVTDTSTGAQTVLTVIVTTAAQVQDHEYVDLGLPSGTLWATCNVGANSPEEYGDYFAWGETEPKSTYSWATYKWCNGSSTSMTKYCKSSSYGTVDNRTELLPEDDAAYVNWGASWRMPTKTQYDELKLECTWTWSTRNGVNGRLVTGPNGNSLFLPAAGYRDGTSIVSVSTYGYYWLSTLYSSSNSGTCQYFNSSGKYWSGRNRYYGLAVRAVRVP